MLTVHAPIPWPASAVQTPPFAVARPTEIVAPFCAPGAPLRNVCIAMSPAKPGSIKMFGLVASVAPLFAVIMNPEAPSEVENLAATSGLVTSHA